MKHKLKGWMIGGIVGGVIGLIFFLPGLIKELELQRISWTLNFVILVMGIILLGIFVGFIISNIKKKEVWIGAVISICIFLMGLLIAKITGGQFQPFPWTETSFLGKFLLYVSVILLFPAFIVGFLFWGCESMSCAIVTGIIILIVYALIGALIGLIISKIKGRHKK